VNDRLGQLHLLKAADSSFQLQDSRASASASASAVDDTHTGV
jgi:hypothetical protein